MVEGPTAGDVAQALRAGVADGVGQGAVAAAVVLKSKRAKVFVWPKLIIILSNNRLFNEGCKVV